jgi:hypothetical protein
MKTLHSFFTLALLTALMVSTAVAADFYVFTNQHGQRAVINYPPSSGWTPVDGPYASSDAAKRAWGIGTIPADTKRVMKPAKVWF